MVTNVSVPIWRCDICGSMFKQNRDAADRCEKAGQPLILPPGSLMLDHSSDGFLNRVRRGGFRLRKLYPFPDRIGTLAEPHNQAAGHTVVYAVDVDPVQHRDDRGIYRWPNGSQPREIRTQHLAPYAPGVLTAITGNWMGSPGGDPRSDDPGWVLDALGLPRGGMAPSRDTVGDWVRPLTPEIKAVLDELDAWPRPLTPDGHGRRQRSDWAISNRLMTYALERARIPGRKASPLRALWFLRGADEATLMAEVDDLWRRWRDGEQIQVPDPMLLSGRNQLTASKISKRVRDLVAATGLEWPARTDATAFCNLLIEKTLEYRMDTDSHHLFGSLPVVAVYGRKGGVGKSTVAAAVARRLARSGRSTALIDCDVTGPSQHVIHSLGPVATDVEQTMILAAETDVPGLRVFSPGQVFGPAAKAHWNTSTVREWFDFLGTSLDLGDAEIIVLDMPPGDSAVHGIVQSRHRVDLTAQIHVTTGHPLALADTERDLVDSSWRNRRWLVENLSRVRGSVGMGQSVEVRLHGITEDASALADRLGAHWGGSMPWVSNVAELADSPEVARLVDQVAAFAKVGEQAVSFAFAATAPKPPAVDCG